MTLKSPLKSKPWIDAALGLFYPNVCQICLAGEAGRDEGYVCLECRAEGVHVIEPPFCSRCGLKFRGEITEEFTCSNCAEMDLHFDSARAAVEFTPLVQEIVHRYKYNRAVWFEPFLAELLNGAALPIVNSERFDLIVPIPLHPLKLRQREFNQAAQLARALSGATGISVGSRLVRRARDTETQTALSRAKRTENMKNAFDWRSSRKLDGERIVLIDDILTTGATASACAKVLRQNGASSVNVWTVARGGLK